MALDFVCACGWQGTGVEKMLAFEIYALMSGFCAAQGEACGCLPFGNSHTHRNLSISLTFGNSILAKFIR
jgi:hypothetical protein